jgi:hypothetical protein
MVCLFYCYGDIDWEEGTVKNIHLATFTQEYKNLFDRLATVQVTQLTNLLKTIFLNELENKVNKGLLNQLMSL